ncbi:S-adenosyl-L-methionine-dependent methyltransferase [Pavlovales sp. CCMP2436]|nr:S-adenosyl-L-methionine-dependent methyltransferase [Pavlovales sp. CCMP2436]
MTAHNAWDSVPWDAELEVATLRAARAQSTAPEEAAQAVCAQSDFKWNEFYRANLLAYKHRRYLHAEFPELTLLLERAGFDTDEPGGGSGGGGSDGSGMGKNNALVFEIGCGPGNAALPLLAQFPRARVCACDVSAAAVRLLTAHPSFEPARCTACVWDVADERGLPGCVAEDSVDAALLIFVLSALPPSAFERAARNVFTALKPGGLLLFRDYGSCDEKQRKFNRCGTKLGESWYARQNGTMVYFFDTAQIDALFVKCGFEPVPVPAAPIPASIGSDAASGGGAAVSLGAASLGGAARFDKLLTVNRKTSEKLWRVWVTGRYRKPGETPA